MTSANPARGLDLAVRSVRSVARRSLAAVAALAALGACDVDPTTPPELVRNPDVQAAPDLSSPVTAAAVYSQDYLWNGGTPTPMGTVVGRVCFLTRVQGEFSSPLDYVRISAQSGTWYLTGHRARASQGVSARARCFSVPSYTNEYVAISTGSGVWKDLYGMACGLTGVGGRFDSQSDKANIIPSGKWNENRDLIVAASPGGYVEGRVRCAPETLGWQMPDWAWFQTSPGAKQLLTNSAVCYLTGMRGAFEGSSEWIGVYQNPYTYPGNYWWLGGGSQQTGVAALAGCVP